MTGSAAAAAAEHYAQGEAVAQSFPSDLREILQRRSSRDPSTRFPRKLHAILSYISANPDLEDQAGIGWIDDTVFRIYKPRLLGVLGLKLNTLNVNLRDLHFVQLQSDRSGWTRWRRDGFNRREFDIAGHAEDDPVGFFAAQQPAQVTVPPETVAISRISPDQFDAFRDHAFLEWQGIVDSVSDLSVSSVFFVSKAAVRYRLPKQPGGNAFDVIQAIIAPQNQVSIKIEEFYRFLARFGPNETVMLKVQSLLETATARRPWLYFGACPSSSRTVYGTFDDVETNALVIRRGKTEIDRVWNLPLVPFGEQFIIDKADRMYGSWEEYFQVNPVPEDGETLG
jgi:hypothetical protein